MTKEFTEFLQGKTVIVCKDRESLDELWEYAHREGYTHVNFGSDFPYGQYDEGEDYRIGFNKSRNSLWLVRNHADLAHMMGEYAFPPVAKYWHYSRSIISESGFYW